MAKKRLTGNVVTQRSSTAKSDLSRKAAPAEARGKRRGVGRIATPSVVFWIMLGINTVNYLDRLLAAAVGPTIQREFHLTQSDIGFLSSAFIVVYTLAALPLGLLADRFARARVVAFGVGLWSIASTATGLISGFGPLFAARAAVGIGEASYYPAGTALLGGYYPIKDRARIMSRWSSGQIIGTALAFVTIAITSATLGETIGWRVAFIITGPIGLFLAILMWFVAETPRPQTVASATGQAAHAAKPSTKGNAGGPKTDAVIQRNESVGQRLNRIVRIRSVWIVVVLQAVSFVIITPSITFLPIYVREASGPFHLNATTGAVVEGIPIVLGGMGGALLGGYVSDWLSKRYKGSRVLTASIGSALAIPTYALMLLTHSLPLFIVAATIAIFAIFLPVGPVSAILQDAIPPALRATAIALALLLSHVFGDFWSPSAVGALATALNNDTSRALLIIVLPALAIAVVTGLLTARIYAAEARYDGGVALPMH